MPDLRELLADGRVHVVDGAMGTMLYEQGRLPQRLLRRAQPEAARRWSARSTRSTCAPAPSSSRPTPSAPTRSSSRTHGLAEDTEADQHAAAAVSRGRRPEPAPRSSARSARSACGSSPSARLRSQEARAAFARQVTRPAGRRRGWLHPGDLQRRGGAPRRGRAVRERLGPAGHRPDDRRGPTAGPHYGTAPSTFGPALEAMGVDVIGVNCSVGPHGVLEAIEKLARVVALPISRQPNAGLPRDVGDRKMYMASPGVHGELRAPHGRGRRAVRGRLLRHHARAHQGDRRASSRASRRATCTP